MISLTKEEMNEINGGISFGSKVFLFVGLISFIIRIILYKCRRYEWCTFN